MSLSGQLLINGIILPDDSIITESSCQPKDVAFMLEYDTRQAIWINIDEQDKQILPILGGHRIDYL